MIPDHLTPTIELTPSDEDVAILAQGVIMHGRAEVGVGEPIKIASFLRDDNNTVISGASARIEFNRLYVDFLWTIKSQRGQGLGQCVLEKLEEAARAQKCKDALIETLSDRTAAYYQRQGYKTLGEVVGYIPGLTKHTLIKKFA